MGAAKELCHDESGYYFPSNHESAEPYECFPPSRRKVYGPRNSALSWRVLTDKDAAREAIDEGDGVARVDEIEQRGVRSAWARLGADPMATLADVLIQPRMHRIDLLAEAFWRDGYPDPHGKIALCQMLLRS